MRKVRHPLPIAFGFLLALAAAGWSLAGVPAEAKRFKRKLPMVQGEWGKVITLPDRERLRDWRKAWLEGLTQARAEGFGAAINREGALLDPDAALDGPAIPDGLYHCRTIQLGRKNSLGKAFKQSPVAACRVRDLRLKVLDGIQRPVGQLWRYDGTKLIFLGATVVGDETASIPYGRDKERDMLGLLDRIGKDRWRLALPHPAWEAQVDIVEITPAG